MYELVTIFTHLLWYVPYIREEKVKVKLLINFNSLNFKEQIEYDNDKTMDKVIRKERICYQ